MGEYPEEEDDSLDKRSFSCPDEDSTGLDDEFLQANIREAFRQLEAEEEEAANASFDPLHLEPFFDVEIGFDDTIFSAGWTEMTTWEVYDYLSDTDYDTDEISDYDSDDDENMEEFVLEDDVRIPFYPKERCSG